MPITALIRNAQQYKLDVHLVSSQLCSRVCVYNGWDAITDNHTQERCSTARHRLGCTLFGWVTKCCLCELYNSYDIDTSHRKSTTGLLFEIWDDSQPNKPRVCLEVDHRHCRYRSLSSGANSHTLIQSCPKLPMIRTEAH